MIFTKTKLNNGKIAVINEVKGSDLFLASLYTGNDPGLFPYYLLAEVMYVDNKKIDIEYIKNMDVSDVMELLEIISLQTKKRQ